SSIRQALNSSRPSLEGKGTKTETATTERPEIQRENAEPDPAKPKVEPNLIAQHRTEPEPARDPILSDGWERDEDEEEQLAQAEKAYADSIDKVMAADDTLAAAHEEIKRQAAEIATLKLARDGYLNGKSAVVKLLKAEQRKTKKLGAMLDKT